MDEGQEREYLVSQIWEEFQKTVLPNLNKGNYPKILDVGDAIVTSGNIIENDNNTSSTWSVVYLDKLLGNIYIMWNNNGLTQFKYVDKQDPNFIVSLL